MENVESFASVQPGGRYFEKLCRLISKCYCIVFIPFPTAVICKLFYHHGAILTNDSVSNN